MSNDATSSHPLARFARWIAPIVVAAALIPGGPPARAAEVDLELVFAVDISGSIDEVEAVMQRQGYVAALGNPAVIKAIQRGMLGRIAVSYIEWARADFQRVVVPWTVIQDEASAKAFAARIDQAPYGSGPRTSISGAIDFSVTLFDDNGFEGLRRIIDISGDGRNNNGRPAADARDDAVGKGITINGIPIMNDRVNFGIPSDPQLDQYYRDNVIGGPGSFLVVAENFGAFGQAILGKLVLEIARLAPLEN